MEEPALRDVERWKDKIEVRLDNRQVFFLFFGSAVVACLLFVLGVIVGKRIESRGRADAPEIQDPLAVLDRASQPAPAPAPGEQELTFPKTLIGSGGSAATRAKAAATRSAPPATAPVAAPAAPPAKGKFTLQVGTYQSKEEAEALAKKYAAQGSFIVAGDIPGKGLSYRVRCGNFASLQEATAAKTAFEKQNKTIALVSAR